MAKYIAVLGILFLTSGFSPYAQSKKRDGDYYYKIKTYDRAIKGFLRELKKDRDNEKLLEKLVDCYLNSNVDRSVALPYVKKLVEKEPSVNNLLSYGKVLFYAGDYKSALKQLDEVKSMLGSEDKLFIEAKQYQNWIINAKAYKAKPLDVEFINMGKKINTAKSEVNPMVSDNENLLAYSSNKRYYSAIGIYYYNICVSHNHNFNWQKGKTIGSTLNSGYDEIVSGLTPDGSKLFVYHNRDWDEQIGFANYLGNYKFTRLEPFDKGWGKKEGTYGVWQSTNSDTLIYVQESEEGNTDIYYSIKLPNGEQGPSRPLPGQVNTKAEENFPVLTNNGKRLYFSSNNSASMGGFDLFYSDWDKSKKEWGKPVNLGYPINDEYDNYSISYPKSMRYAYVASIRPEGYGERDIYKVVFKSENPTNLLLKCKVKLQTDTGLIIPPYKLRAELNDSISGTKIGQYNLSSDSAKFIMAIEPGKYMLSIYKDDALLYTSPISVPELWFGNIPHNREFVIPKKTKEED